MIKRLCRPDALTTAYLAGIAALRVFDRLGDAALAARRGASARVALPIWVAREA